MSSILVLGYGRVGEATTYLLSRRGFNVIVADISASRLERAKSRGYEVLKLNATLDSEVDKIPKVDIICTALPGNIAFNVLKKLASRGYNVVDVSYTQEDPIELNEYLKTHNNFIVVDAGIAPGLSNMLVGHTYKYAKERVKSVKIYVGGLPQNPNINPLKTVITWSPIDLLDEYVRRARIKRNGRIEHVDPLSITGEIEIRGFGTFEYFVTDGLRTMLHKLTNIDNMYEYTLRFKGHLEIMKILKSLNLLSWDPIDVTGVRVKPIEVLAKLLELKFKDEYRDQLIMFIEIITESEVYEWFVHAMYDDKLGLTAMSKTTGFTQALIAEAALKGYFERYTGLITPEEIGMWDKAFNHVISALRGYDVKIQNHSYT